MIQIELLFSAVLFFNICVCVYVSDGRDVMLYLSLSEHDERCLFKPLLILCIFLYIFGEMSWQVIVCRVSVCVNLIFCQFVSTAFNVYLLLNCFLILNFIIKTSFFITNYSTFFFLYLIRYEFPLCWPL